MPDVVGGGEQAEAGDRHAEVLADGAGRRSPGGPVDRGHREGGPAQDEDDPAISGVRGGCMYRGHRESFRAMRKGNRRPPELAATVVPTTMEPREWSVIQCRFAGRGMF